MFVCASSPIHLEGRCWFTCACVRRIPFRLTITELHQSQHVAAWCRMYCKALVVGTKVVVQPVCGRTICEQLDAVRISVVMVCVEAC